MTEYSHFYWCPKCQDVHPHMETVYFITCMECGVEYRLYVNSPEREERKDKGDEIGRENLMKLSVERDERGM